MWWYNDIWWYHNCDDIRIVMISWLWWYHYCDDIMIMMISGLWWYQDTERRARWRFNGTNVVARRANCQRHITCWESTNPTHCVSSLKSVNSLFEKKLLCGSFDYLSTVSCHVFVKIGKRTNLTKHTFQMSKHICAHEWVGGETRWAMPGEKNQSLFFKRLMVERERIVWMQKKEMIKKKNIWTGQK